MSKFDFEVEDMVKFGEDQLKNDSLSDEMVAFHKFTVEMLNYELGIDAMANQTIGGKKSLMGKSIQGAKVLAITAGSMRQFAKTTAYDLGIKRVWPIRKAVNPLVRANPKKSMPWFYYKTGLRYLMGVGWR
jgi:hypothetical protein